MSVETVNRSLIVNLQVATTINWLQIGRYKFSICSEQHMLSIPRELLLHNTVSSHHICPPLFIARWSSMRTIARTDAATKYPMVRKCGKMDRKFNIVRYNSSRMFYIGSLSRIRSHKPPNNVALPSAASRFR